MPQQISPPLPNLDTPCPFCKSGDWSQETIDSRSQEEGGWQRWHRECWYKASDAGWFRRLTGPETTKEREKRLSNDRKSA